MKTGIFFKDIQKKIIRLSKNEIVSVKGKNIRIDCLYGNLWITLPGGTEKILKSNETISVSLKGKICIVAFSESSVQVQKREWHLLHLFNQTSEVLNASEARKLFYIYDL